jgi:ribosomal protein S18 acetylase RimI-like enzyme
MIRILTANHAHAELLSNLGAETFYEWFTEGNNPEDVQQYVREAFSLSQIKRELDEPGTVFMLAQEGDQVAGYMKLRISDEVSFPGKRCLELHRLYITRGFIRKKVGSIFMEQAIGYAQANGFDILWLGVWEKNERALAFYKKWGFEQFSAHTFMLGNDAQTDLMMKLEVKR